MLPRLTCAALALALLYAPARAQKDHDRDEKLQPELHIKLVIAQAVLTPHDKDRDHGRDDRAVVYKLAPAPEAFSVRREFRSMLIEGTRHEQVELTTIVLK